MQVQVPAQRPGTFEESGGGRNHGIGARRFGGVGQRTAYRTEHPVQVRIDEALAGGDRIDIANADHQVHRQRGRCLRDGVEHMGHHFNRPRLVAMDANRHYHAGAFRRSFALDRHDALGRQAYRETGICETPCDGAEISFGERAYGVRQLW